MDTFIGIDCGLTRANPTGVAILSTEDLLATQAIILDESTPWTERLRELTPILRDLFCHYVPKVIAYELPYTGINMLVGIQLAHIGGVIAALCAELPCQYLWVSPTQAKKALTGKGSADKQQMIVAAHDRFNVTLAKDEADALGVALVGRASYLE